MTTLINEIQNPEQQKQLRHLWYKTFAGC